MDTIGAVEEGLAGLTGIPGATGWCAAGPGSIEGQGSPCTSVTAIAGDDITGIIVGMTDMTADAIADFQAAESGGIHSPPPNTGGPSTVIVTEQTAAPALLGFH